MNAVLTFLNQSWFLLVVIISVIVLAVRATKKFSELPSEEQVKKVKEWLLWAVVLAEKELGAGTGQVKLRLVYDRWIERFPSLVAVVSFDLFASWVDEALEQMRHLLETNPKVRAFVEGGEEDEHTS